MQCPACKRTAPDDFAFCAYCGSRLPLSVAASPGPQWAPPLAVYPAAVAPPLSPAGSTALTWSVVETGPSVVLAALPWFGLPALLWLTILGFGGTSSLTIAAPFLGLLFVRLVSALIRGVATAFASLVGAALGFLVTIALGIDGLTRNIQTWHIVVGFLFLGAAIALSSLRLDHLDSRVPGRGVTPRWTGVELPIGIGLTMGGLLTLLTWHISWGWVLTIAGGLTFVVGLPLSAFMVVQALRAVPPTLPASSPSPALPQVALAALSIIRVFLTMLSFWGVFLVLPVLVYESGGLAGIGTSGLSILLVILSLAGIAGALLATVLARQSAKLAAATAIGWSFWAVFAAILIIVVALVQSLWNFYVVLPVLVIFGFGIFAPFSFHRLTPAAATLNGRWPAAGAALSPAATALAAVFAGFLTGWLMYGYGLAWPLTVAGVFLILAGGVSLVLGALALMVKPEQSAGA